jgi:hypothetical protein
VSAATFTVTVTENLLARFVALSRDLTWMRADRPPSPATSVRLIAASQPR